MNAAAAAAADPDPPMFWRAGQAIGRRRFERDAAALAAAVPSCRHALNLCRDRYLFALALVALGARAGTSLLPPSEAPEMLARLAQDYDAAPALTDEWVSQRLERSAAAPEAPLVIAPEHITARVLTSGSSGRPQAHAKTWHNLTAGAALAAGPLFGATHPGIVATVPPQHMFGLEFSIVIALIHRAAVHAGRPFFPRDIAEALAQLPPPRVLLSTPVHLRALLAAGIELPPLHSVVSATAPLDAGLAARLEQRHACEVREIYGCTEAGSIALRRTVEGPSWRAHPGIRIEVGEDRTRVAGAHLAEPQVLADRLQFAADGRFELLGRGSDLLKVAGKRASLAELTQRLLAVDGVEDGVIFMPDDGGLARPAALVVAPGRSVAEILDALAQQLDPLFLPRPLRKVAALPRNAVGKLPLSLLMQWLEKAHD